MSQIVGSGLCETCFHRGVCKEYDSPGQAVGCMSYVSEKLIPRRPVYPVVSRRPAGAFRAYEGRDLIDGDLRTVLVDERHQEQYFLCGACRQEIDPSRSYCSCCGSMIVLTAEEKAAATKKMFAQEKEGAE